MHPLLKQQLESYLHIANKEEAVPEVQAFIHAVETAYLNYDKEKTSLVQSLEETTKELQELTEHSKNQFISIASHEMRTPLAIIRGNAELLLDENAIKGDKTLTDSTKSILHNAVRLLEIVNDFLDVQNLENGKIELKQEPINLITLLQSTIDDLTKLSEEKNNRLVFVHEDDGSIPTCMLDMSRLQQICVNIISNAIHYTENGKITVTIKREGNNVKIYFEDTGRGIAPEDQGRLFKKFETGKVFLKSREYGSGLGLYISNMFANLMKCELKLENSVVGVGSAFSLTIPITTQA